MINSNLLYNALAKHGIEEPPYYNSNDFMRWGKNNRFWAKELEDGYIFGDFVDGISSNVFSKTEKPLSEIEKKERKERIDKATKETEAEQLKQWEETAKKAVEIWESLKSEDINHLYLIKKQVKAYNLRQHENKLVLPLYDTNGKIWGVEAGFDIQKDINNMLGLFISYRNGEYDLSGKTSKFVDGIGSEINIDSYLAGLYYRYDKNNTWVFASVYGGMQDANIDTDDNVVNIETDGIEFGANAEAGYSFVLNKKTTYHQA